MERTASVHVNPTTLTPLLCNPPHPPPSLSVPFCPCRPPGTHLHQASQSCTLQSRAPQGPFLADFCWELSSIPFVSRVWCVFDMKSYMDIYDLMHMCAYILLTHIYGSRFPNKLYTTSVFFFTPLVCGFLSTGISWQLTEHPTQASWILGRLGGWLRIF